MSYLLARFASWLLRYVHDAIGYPLFGLGARLNYRLNGSGREIVVANLRHVIGPSAGERELQACAAEAFRCLAWNYYELFHMPAFSRDALRRRMDIEGLEHIDRALERGKGALLVSVHYGNIETLLQVPTLYPYMRFMLLVEKMTNRKVFELVKNLRASAGIDLAAVDEPMKVIKRLKENGVVGLAADRDVTNSGIVVDFFGSPARMPDGPVRLAMLSGAALIPAYGWRETSGRFRVRIEPEVTLLKTGQTEADLRANMRCLLAVFERILAERPGQWVATQRLWI